jgi:hypothetical protein
MDENKYTSIKCKTNEDAVGLMAGERDRSLQYQSPKTTSGLGEEVENTRMKLAQYNSGGDTKETSKENSAAE